MPMQLNTLVDGLKLLRANQKVVVPAAGFADIFPPGQFDRQAMARARELAKHHGCRIEQTPTTVEFIKD